MVVIRAFGIFIFLSIKHAINTFQNHKHTLVSLILLFHLHGEVRRNHLDETFIICALAQQLEYVAHLQFTEVNPLQFPYVLAVGFELIRFINRCIKL